MGKDLWHLFPNSALFSCIPAFLIESLPHDPLLTTPWSQTGACQNGYSCHLCRRMSANLRTLPFMAKVVLVVGLLSGVIFAQSGFGAPLDNPCARPSAVADQRPAAMSCQHCCAAKPCCLVSRSHSDPTPRPEPLSTERNHSLDHASLAVTLTTIPTFAFLAPPPRSRASARDLSARATREQAPRGAVSCIWLI